MMLHEFADVEHERYPVGSHRHAGARDRRAQRERMLRSRARADRIAPVHGLEHALPQRCELAERSAATTRADGLESRSDRSPLLRSHYVSNDTTDALALERGKCFTLLRDLR